ncbi:MAG: PspC domain-containing protein [Actinomycetaceae bacterium]|nr:PspC domain-containing protein [Actinomycetaceae bacterium]
MSNSKGIYRSRNNRILGGVAGGLAQKFGVEPGLMRLIFFISIFLPGPQVLIYIAAWILLPEE